MIWHSCTVITFITYLHAKAINHGKCYYAKFSIRTELRNLRHSFRVIDSSNFADNERRRETQRAKITTHQYTRTICYHCMVFFENKWADADVGILERVRVFFPLMGRIIFFAGCYGIPDSKAHGANMGHIWGRQNPGGPHVGSMSFAIWDIFWVATVGVERV